ncbi:MAG TPA: histidine phosphatase family protein [Cyclobacteriaceae bacterium]|nr:histidine phosphatase family protein [Cyclobacteriaceae bacterium]
MTKIIFVLRHAQSAGKQGGQQDYDRVLTPTGEADARALGKKLQAGNFNPDLILASAAVRTKQTTDLVNESLRISEQKIHLKKDLYEALMTHWMDYIHLLPDNENSVLLVGHNPWLSMLASNFAGSMLELGPCELIGFEFTVTRWSEISFSGKEILRIKHS